MAACTSWGAHACPVCAFKSKDAHQRLVCTAVCGCGQSAGRAQRDSQDSTGPHECGGPDDSSCGLTLAGKPSTVLGLSRASSRGRGRAGQCNAMPPCPHASSPALLLSLPTRPPACPHARICTAADFPPKARAAAGRAQCQWLQGVHGSSAGSATACCPADCREGARGSDCRRHGVAGSHGVTPAPAPPPRPPPPPPPPAPVAPPGPALAAAAEFASDGTANAAEAAGVRPRS